MFLAVEDNGLAFQGHQRRQVGLPLTGQLRRIRIGIQTGTSHGIMVLFKCPGMAIGTQTAKAQTTVISLYSEITV